MKAANLLRPAIAIDGIDKLRQTHCEPSQLLRAEPIRRLVLDS
jgi:hypothetical protein